MGCKKIIPYINAENELAVNIIKLAEEYYFSGADELFIYNYSKDETSREEFLGVLKSISKQIDIPFIAGCYIKRFEDIKKALYTGASKVVIKYSILENKNVLKEGSERFGNDKIYVEADYNDMDVDVDFVETMKSMGMEKLLLKHTEKSKRLEDIINNISVPVIIRDSLVRNDITDLMSYENVEALSTNYFKEKDILKAKISLKEQGIYVNTFESNVKFSDFKLNSEGMIPVIAQDYKTNEVLMLAYMNEEAFNKTIATGKMTYYSRSRQELWTKGETSGHLQYVKAIYMDCDNDTLLAKIQQIGVACHTGNRSCFFTELVKREYDDTNPLTVFNDVYNVIMDRKENPKEGSYTNYLFDKGIDKILKKCGEEATEIVIAAKNPDAEELKYEISDFLYHMMVLMVECGLDWNDVVKELAHRR